MQYATTRLKALSVVQLYPGRFPRSKQLFDFGVGGLFGFQACANSVSECVSPVIGAREAAS